MKLNFQLKLRELFFREKTYLENLLTLDLNIHAFNMLDV
jgi:hypothetical protein